MTTDLLHLQRYHESGDAAEFQALVRHHAGMVFATARRVTQDAALAEDVAQETFLELARKGRSVTESVGAWLHRVAWRRACDTVRAEVTRQRHETAALALNEGDECTWEELEPVFDEAISELGAEQRTVIVEHYLEGRTQTEVAARLKVSQSSVSRLLEQSITELRSKLKQKGLLCGAGLAGMMTAVSSTSAAYAVPVTLMASLHKIGLSSIGSGAVVTTTAAAGTALLGGFLGLNLKVAAAAAVAATACAVTYDLASERSLLLSWLGKGEPVAVKETAKRSKTGGGPGGEDATARKARLLAEAKVIWSNKPKLTVAERERLMKGMVYERDADKKWAAFRALGVTLSRSEYDRIVTRHPDIRLFDERRSLHAMAELFNDVFTTWFSKSPREAIVCWSSLRDGPTVLWFPPILDSWVRSHPEEWAAFVEAGPDPRLGDSAKLWVDDLDDPGSIWAKAKDAGMPLDAIAESIYVFIVTGAPADRIYGLIMRAPDAKVRNRYIMGIATKLSPDQLLQAADSGLFDEGLTETLRAMGGDLKARFGIAAAWITKSLKGGYPESQNSHFTTEAIGPFYAGWLKKDARTALQHAVRTDDKRILEIFMAVCAPSPLLTEQLMVESFTSPANRERALAAYYQARADGNPKVALKSIMNSATVVDQIECAKNVLVLWTMKSPSDAAAWVAGLTANEDRNELMAAVATQWAQTDPEAAIAYAHQQGLDLTHGWDYGFAWGARELPEDRLAALLKPLRDDPEYNEMLTMMLGYRYPRKPQMALAYLTKYGAAGWQEPAVDLIIRWIQKDESFTESYATLLPVLDLSQVDPAKVTKAANLFVHNLAAQGQLQPALDWTLKLPGPVAVQVRADALAELAPGEVAQKSAAEKWIRRAPISEGERAALLEYAGRSVERQP